MIDCFWRPYVHIFWRFPIFGLSYTATPGMWCMWSASQLMLWHSQCRWPWQLTAELASEFVLSKLPGLRYIRYMTYIKTGTVYKSSKWRFWMMSVSWERFLAFFSSNLSVAGCFFFQGKGGDLEVPRIFCSATWQQGATSVLKFLLNPETNICWTTQVT